MKKHSANDNNQPAKAPESTPGATITPEVARAALEADLGNIQARAASGKPLTGKQRAILAAVADGMDPKRDVSSHVSTTAELADAIGVDRRTVTRWLRLPDNPGRAPDGRFSVERWLAYKETRPVGLGDHPEKRRRIALQNQKLQWELSELQRRYIPVKAVEAMSADLADKVRSVVRGAIVRVAPELTNATVPVAEAKLKAVEDTILTRLHTLGSA